MLHPMKIKLGDPAVEGLFVTLDGAVIGHLREADEEAGYVIQQLPQQPPVRLDGTVVIHRPAEPLTPAQANEAMAGALERIAAGIRAGTYTVETFLVDNTYDPNDIYKSSPPHIVRATLTLVYTEA